MMRIIKEVLTEAGINLYRYRFPLLRRLLVPLGLLSLSYALRFADTVLVTNFLGTFGPAADEFIVWAGFVISLVALIFFVMAWPLAAIAVHRIMVLGTESVKEYSSFWTRRETWFLLHLFGFALILSPFLLLMLIPEVGDLLAWVAVAYVGSRLSLVFPGIAVDRAVSFRLSWLLTRQYRLPVFVVVALPWVLTMPAAFLSGAWYLVPFTVMLEVMIALYTVTALSLLYREIIDSEYGAVSGAGGVDAPEANAT